MFGGNNYTASTVASERFKFSTGLLVDQLLASVITNETRKGIECIKVAIIIEFSFEYVRLEFVSNYFYSSLGER